MPSSPDGRWLPLPEDSDPASFLGADSIIETDHPEVVALARDLRHGAGAQDEAFAERAFRWVRDEVRHSWDAQDPRVTLTATQVLRQRVGLCYAKAHLLTALLRSQGLPTALCYQRLTHSDGQHVLHGLVAVHLRGEWHRQDPRGNNGQVHAQFRLDREVLAYPIDPDRGEVDHRTLFQTAAPSVVEVLSAATDLFTLYADGLPRGL